MNEVMKVIFSISRIVWAFFTNFLIGYSVYYMISRNKRKSMISGLSSILVDVDHAIYPIFGGIWLEYSFKYFGTPYRFFHLPLLLIAPFFLLKKKTIPIGIGIIFHILTDLLFDPLCQNYLGFPIG